MEAGGRVDVLVALREARPDLLFHFLLAELHLLATQEAIRAGPEAEFLLGRGVGKVRFALAAAVGRIERDRKKQDEEHQNLRRPTVDFYSKDHPV
jgi:hypothetical protein